VGAAVVSGAVQGTLEVLFGGEAAAKSLQFIENYGDGYASRIAKTLGMPISEVQKQLRHRTSTGRPCEIGSPMKGGRTRSFGVSGMQQKQGRGSEPPRNQTLADNM
jgi:hypothetical protein